jgi:phosphonate transport system substrate-binding protein
MPNADARSVFGRLACLVTRIQWTLLAFILGIFVATPAVAITPACSTTYLISTVPQHLPEAHYRHWAPLVKRLEKDTGLCFRLHVPHSIQDFGEHLLAGKPDFAFMNPYHLTLAHRTHGYLPLVRSNETPLVGILVVRSDRAMTKLKDLDGKTIAFPAPDAFAACMMLRQVLDREGIKYTPVFLNSHEAVYRAVIMGDAVAGGGVKTTLAQESEHVQQALTIVATTPPAIQHPFATHPRVPADVRRAVSDALLAMAGDAEGQEILRRVGLPMPVAADYVRDYQSLETLKLELPPRQAAH